MIRIEEILEKVIEYSPEADLNLLRRAYVYSAKAHKGQKRKSGEPYLSHPLEVMNILAQLRMDLSSLATGLLHDTVEDSPDVTIEEVSELFGDEIAILVDGVTKIGQMTFSSQAEKQAENFKKIILATVKDIRVIVIKLADRLHNMRTLQHMTEAQQVRIAQETIDIYAPLANRLGIHWIKSELEDLCFRYLYKNEHRTLKTKLDKHRKPREKYIKDVIEIIRNLLAENKIEGEILGRLKNLYNIHRKMIDQKLEFEQVHDLIAFRIITDSVQECYEVLGIIHSMWTPVPGRFKDYIALPKDNMYQSLHTTVVGPSGERIEIQIRTHEMHQFAEEGIAAHWGYKEKKQVEEKDGAKFAWLRQLLEWRTETEDPQEFLDNVKFDLFPNEVYVFTPNGDVVALPKGSTPIDFAYRIHTEVGHQCVGSRVNGVMVPLKYNLKSGDHVEVMTSKGHTPSRDWLKIVGTNSAKAKIRSFLRKEERIQSAQLGRSILEKALKKYKMSLAKLEKSGTVSEVSEKVNVGSGDEALYAAIGYGKILPANLIKHFVPEDVLESSTENKKESIITKVFKTRRGKSSGITIKGIDDVMARVAKCCHPVPGEPIVGFITRGRGITVHAASCPEVQYMDPERQIDVQWDTSSGSLFGAATIQIYSIDTQGLLAEVTKTIATQGCDVKKVHIETTDDKHANHKFDLVVRDIQQLKSLIKSLEKIKGVIRVERL